MSLCFVDFCFWLEHRNWLFWTVLVIHRIKFYLVLFFFVLFEFELMGNKKKKLKCVYVWIWLLLEQFVVWQRIHPGCLSTKSTNGSIEIWQYVCRYVFVIGAFSAKNKMFSLLAYPWLWHWISSPHLYAILFDFGRFLPSMRNDSNEFCSVLLLMWNH